MERMAGWQVVDDRRVVVVLVAPWRRRDMQ